MSLTATQVQNNVHRNCLEWRAIDAFVFSDRFEEAYRRASEPEREKLTKILEDGALVYVKRWADRQLLGPLRHRSYRQLRELAKRLGVPRWSRLDRDTLLETLLEDRYAASLRERGEVAE